MTTVHPGGINTRIAESALVGVGVDPAEYEQEREIWTRLLSIPPERAAAQIAAAIENRRPRVLIGASAKIPDALARLLPTGWTRVYGAGQRGARALAIRQAGRPAR